MQVLVNVLLVINVFVCVALIAVVLLQRSEGGALGMGGGGGPGNFMTARGAGDLLTRVTWILAAPAGWAPPRSRRIADANFAEYVRSEARISAGVRAASPAAPVSPRGKTMFASWRELM